MYLRICPYTCICIYIYIRILYLCNSISTSCTFHHVSAIRAHSAWRGRRLPSWRPAARRAAPAVARRPPPAEACRPSFWLLPQAEGCFFSMVATGLYGHLMGFIWFQYRFIEMIMGSYWDVDGYTGDLPWFTGDLIVLEWDFMVA